jgi:hypothetical protein
MRQAIGLGLMLLLTIVITGCGRVIGSTPRPNQASTGGAMSLTDLHNMSDLQTRFNQDAGKPRLVLLVSPT